MKRTETGNCINAYVPPVVDSVTVHVENGFAASNGEVPAPGDNDLGEI